MRDPKKVEIFLDHIPFCKALGIHVADAADGKPAMVLPYRQELIGDSVTNVLHGGPVSVLLDTCLGAEAFVHPENASPTATIDLRIDYMRAARPNENIYARGEVYHLTKHVAFVRGSAWDQDMNKPIATATGTFTFDRKQETK